MSEWNTAAVTIMNALFCKASLFNSNLSKWNTAAVTDMRLVFVKASLFNTCSDLSECREHDRSDNNNSHVPWSLFT